VTSFSENILNFSKGPLSVCELDDGIEINLLAKTPRKNSMLMVESPKDPGMGKMELILEKITMPSPLGSVFRPRLQALLEQSLASCTSTIASGRAGTGKTTLALDFADRCGRVVAWYKLDAPDSELRIFFQYLIASINGRRRGFGNGALAQLLGQPDVPLPSLAEAFVHELEHTLGPPLLVVIEDLHLVSDAEWLVPFFRRLLPLLPSDVHMLITSRTMPPAPLWRMRSKQTLSVIDEETLSFNKQEAVDLFQSFNLTPQQASIAWDHSHGRAAALATLAATLHYAENQSAETFMRKEDRADVS
jgi:LuxR family transcriptional regulator, maltose regulon positive regulatory protein